MSKDKEKKRAQQQVKHRLRERSEERRASQDTIAQGIAETLADPERFAQALRNFSTVSLISPALSRFRLAPREELVLAILAHRPPAGADEQTARKALRTAIIPKFATQALLKDLVGQLRKAQGDCEDEDQLLGVLAAQTLAGSCLEAGAPADHIFWELPFDLQLTEAVLAGDLFVGAVLSRLAPPADLGARIAKALAQGELSRELDTLGLRHHEASAFVSSYADAVKDPEGYHLQLDGVLFLLQAQQALALAPAGRAILRQGLDDAAIDDLVARASAAYEQDVAESLSGELVRWARERLSRLRDAPPKEVPQEALEAERLRAATLLVGLRLLPRSEDALLRAIHARGLLLGRRLAPELEVPFVQRISAQPEDGFALDDYERLLTESGELPRARRVRRYRDALRARASTEKNGGGPAT